MGRFSSVKLKFGLLSDSTSNWVGNHSVAKPTHSDARAEKSKKNGLTIYFQNIFVFLYDTSIVCFQNVIKIE